MDILNELLDSRTILIFLFVVVYALPFLYYYYIYKNRNKNTFVFILETIVFHLLSLIIYYLIGNSIICTD